MKFPFFRHKRMDAAIPTSHQRVALIADRFNATITRLDEERERVIAEIADKSEELRQLEVTIGAMRAGLTHIVDDVSLTFGAANEARAHITEGDKNFIDLDREIGLANYNEAVS